MESLGLDGLASARERPFFRRVPFLLAFRRSGVPQHILKRRSVTMLENPADFQENDQERRTLSVGRASWHAISRGEFETVRQLAGGPWKEQLDGIELPWLCWHVDEQWSLVQQRMVSAAGWTPVVGNDPRAGRPPLIDGAVYVDFNDGLGLPALSMLFPLEFVYLFSSRLAFWHSDLLIREPMFFQLAEEFRALQDGATAAVDGRKRWYRNLLGKRGRYWELIGCTTRGASRDQYKNACGWWRHQHLHPNCTTDSSKRVRQRYTIDHGAGILVWEEQHGGVVHTLPSRPLEEGHCTRIGNKRYTPLSPNDWRRDLSKDLSFNYDIREVCSRLGLTKYLF